MRALLLAAACVCGCASSPALHDDDFLRVTVGMTQADVRRALGPPARTEAFGRQRQLAWDYSFRDAWGYFAFVSVMFDADGRVIGKTHTRIEPNDN